MWFDAYAQMRLDGEGPDFGKSPVSPRVLDQPPCYPCGTMTYISGCYADKNMAPGL